MLTLEESILNHCAPTLAGVKASSMFSVRHCNQSRNTLAHELLLWKVRLLTKGITLRILNYQESNSSFLILVYRKQELKNSLLQKNKLSYLSKYEYPIELSLEHMLRFLSKRIRTSDSFPHEIGFFLDYPTQDVIGFIENNGANYTCNGLWKSYSAPKEAMARFNLIRQCTEEYWEAYDQGKTVMQLIQVA